MQKFNEFIKDEQTGARKRIGKKVGRNEKCPCGAENKFKRCCGK